MPYRADGGPLTGTGGVGVPGWTRPTWPGAYAGQMVGC